MKRQPINVRLELLFILLATALAGFLVFPIWHAQFDFPFLIKNIVLVFAAVLLFKHVFFLKYTWLSHFQKIRIALIPFSVPIIFIFIRILNQFTTYIDENAIADFMDHLSFEKQQFLTNYVRMEFVTVAVMAIAGAIALPFRLLVSIWKEVNKRG